MPYQASGWWPTSCANQFNEALTHRNLIRKKTRRENLSSNQNNQVTRMFFMRIPKHQVITRRALILWMCTRTRIGVQSVEIQSMWKVFNALQWNPNVKLVTSLDISLVFVIKRSKHHSSLEDQTFINYKWEQCMCKRHPYAATLKITVQWWLILLADQSAANTSQLKDDYHTNSPNY